MPLEDNGETFDEITEQLESLNANLAKFDQYEAPLQAEFDAIKFSMDYIKDDFEEKIRALRKEMESKLKEKREAYLTKQELLGKLRLKKRQIELEKEELTRKQQEKIEFEKAQAAVALLHERWDKVAMGAPWREWSKDFQILAAKQWAQQKTMILADEMGLGKTLEAIMGIEFIRAATEFASPDNPYEADEVERYERDENDNWRMVTRYVNGVEKPCGIRVLYLCPSSLVKNVVNEFRRWAPHRSVVPIGNIPQAQRDFAIDVGNIHDEFVMVLNYEAWRYGLNTLIGKLVSLNFDTVILDEAHGFKDTRTSVYQGVKSFADRSKAPFKLPMTGTPVLNKPHDIFPLLHIIEPNRWSDKRSFLDEFCEQDWEGDWDWKPGGVASLGARLGHKYLRRTMEDVGEDVPKQTVTIHNVPVDKELYKDQARARKQMKENAMVMLKNSVDENGQPKSIDALAKIAIYTRLRQIETWPAGIKLRDPKTKEVIEELDVEESQKLDYIFQSYGSTDSGEFGSKHKQPASGLLANYLENNRRVLVFSQFVEPLRELYRRLRASGFRPAVLTGETSILERERIHRDFDKKHQTMDSPHEFDVALCHYKVGGVGFNLTGATRTIILDEEWNPGKRDQAYKRTRRIGQDEETHVDVIRMERTIDDWLGGIMEKKEHMVQGFEKMQQPDIEDFLKNSDDSGLL